MPRMTLLTRDISAKIAASGIRTTVMPAAVRGLVKDLVVLFWWWLWPVMEAWVDLWVFGYPSAWITVNVLLEAAFKRKRWTVREEPWVRIISLLWMWSVA